MIIGLDDTFAPMGFRDKKDKLVGLDIDLANAVAKELGVKVKFQPIDWEAKEAELKSKKIDCIWNEAYRSMKNTSRYPYGGTPRDAVPPRPQTKKKKKRRRSVLGTLFLAIILLLLLSIGLASADVAWYVVKISDLSKIFFIFKVILQSFQQLFFCNLLFIVNQFF